MMEAVYASLSSNLGLLYASGTSAPMRTGNRHGGLSLCPYNVYPSQDGYIAIICNHEAHWLGLLKVMGRPDLAQDERCRDMTERVRHMDFVDAEVAAWTMQHPKQALFEKLIVERVPSAPVRTLDEVIADPHLHASGLLAEIDHPDFGTITVSRSPLRYHGSALSELRPSPRLGSGNGAVLSGWLGLPEARVQALREMKVI